MSFALQRYSLEEQLLLTCLSASPDREDLATLLHQKPDWDELYRLGQTHTVLQLIYQAVKSYPDTLVPARVLKRLQAEFAAHTLRSMQLKNELRRIVELLTAAQIAVIPFKGPTLAEEVYGDIGLRSFVDLDLLVPPPQAQAAVEILLADGYRTDFELPPQRWAGLQRVDNHLPLHHPRQHWSVEIHWELFHPIHMQPFELGSHWSRLAAGGEGRLGPEETLVMLCAHGGKHFWEQLKWLVDIDRLIRNSARLDWQAAFALARRSASLRALLLGLKLARTLLGSPLPDAVAEKIAADERIRSLTETVEEKLFSQDPERKQYLREYSFHLKSRDNPADCVRQLVRWWFWPRLADWQLFRLGDYVHALYYLQRPLRMVVKYLFLAGFSGSTGRR